MIATASSNMQCSGKGPSHLKEASAAVLSRVQQFEAVSRLELPENVPEPMELQWGNLKVETLLGAGSFSVVYKARVKALSKRPHSGSTTTSCTSSTTSSTSSSTSKSSSKKEEHMYALKSLSTETICCNESFVTGAIDLALEAKILAKLHHENVIQLHGVKGGNIAESFSHSQGSGGGFFLVLDLLEETLDMRLQSWREQEAKASKISVKNMFNRKKRAQKRLQGVVDRLDNVVLGVVRGMEYIHSRNIILRDLKPHNIGFDHQGKVRIFDFGLARELTPEGESDAAHARCNTGIAGTLRYISPENALGHKCGLSCDVYSFAILFYEIITLQVPFSEIKLVAHFKEKVIRGRHRPDLTYVPSSLLQDLLNDSWDPNPTKRPSFSEIRCIMEEIISTGLLTKEGEWRKFAFKNTKPTDAQTCAECGMDNSAGSGHVRNLSGSHNHHHHAAGVHSHESATMKHILEEMRAEEQIVAAKRAGMPESHHGGLNDQMRSLTDNISFNSRNSSKVHPL